MQSYYKAPPVHFQQLHSGWQGWDKKLQPPPLLPSVQPPTQLNPALPTTKKHDRKSLHCPHYDEELGCQCPEPQPSTAAQPSTEPQPPALKTEPQPSTESQPSTGPQPSTMPPWPSWDEIEKSMDTQPSTEPQPSASSTEPQPSTEPQLSTEPQPSTQPQMPTQWPDFNLIVAFMRAISIEDCVTAKKALRDAMAKQHYNPPAILKAAIDAKSVREMIAAQDSMLKTMSSWVATEPMPRQSNEQHWQSNEQWQSSGQPGQSSKQPEQSKPSTTVRMPPAPTEDPPPPPDAINPEYTCEGCQAHWTLDGQDRDYHLPVDHMELFGVCPTCEAPLVQTEQARPPPKPGHIWGAFGPVSPSPPGRWQEPIKAPPDNATPHKAPTSSQPRISEPSGKR